MAKKIKSLPRPLFDRIIVKPLPQETITPGGIVLPDQTKETSCRGEVVAVGGGRYIREQDYVREVAVVVGDIIFYSSLDGVEIKHGGETYLVLSEVDVVAVEQ